jgi:ribosomal-protein-alanine N-acetyltransferase
MAGTVSHPGSIEADGETGNAASRSLLSRTGFRLEGTWVDCEIKDGAFISLDLFARLGPGPR